MKRFTLLMAMLLAVTSFSFAQRSPADRITPALRAELEKRTGADEQFRIIITMADQYDQVKLNKQANATKGEQRREVVINELSRFSAASQADLLKTMKEGQKANIVKEVYPFWIFNGVSCITNREMIYALSERPDIARIESDEMRNMLPENNLRSNGNYNNGSTAQTMQTNRDGRTTIAWNVTQVNADKVWTYNGTSGYKGNGVVVAVIDTGVDYYHPDLKNHMWHPADGAACDTLGTYEMDGQTYKHPGYDFVNNDKDPVDDNGHGSHCAGTVAGYGTSGIQTGMAPEAKIMALKVLSNAGSGSTTAIMKAMQFATKNGADVISMSLGGHGNVLTQLLAPGSNAEYRIAFDAVLAANVVAVVAAGNEGEYYSSLHRMPNSLGGNLGGTYYEVPDNVGSPGNCPSPWPHPDQTLAGGQSGVITIGASTRDDRKSTFSSFGPVQWKNETSGDITYNDYPYSTGSSPSMGLIKPDVIVPGTDITSCLYTYHIVPQTGDTTHPQTTVAYVSECGTSMATPGAAGIVALMLSADPSLTPRKVDSILEVTALPVDFRTNKNNTTGSGRADAKAAVDAIFTQATKPANFAIGAISGGCVELSWDASTAPKGYAIYRDNEQVGTTTATTYTDKNPGVGKHTYYVRAIDNASIQSVRSDAAVCNVGPYAFADDAKITWDDEKTATLGWIPTKSNGNLATGDLKYGTQTNTAFTNSRFKSAWWGIRFTPEELRPYLGMQINSVEFYIFKDGITSTDHIFLEIYRGTENGNTTGTPVYHREFLVSDVDQWTHVTLDLTAANYISTGQNSGPYVIDDISQDLWITFKDRITAGQEYPIAVDAYFDADANHTSDCFYMGSEPFGLELDRNSMCWTHLPDYGTGYNKYALSCKANLVPAKTYTDSYTVDYPDETSTETVTGISGNYTKTHIPTLSSGNNTYNITAKLTEGSNTYESCPQDLTIVKVDSDQTISNVDIDQTKVYLVKDNSTLTANNLTCTEPSRLIIDDGSQLVTSSAVSGTVKKQILSTGSEGGGWNFIASPLVGNTPIANVTNLNSNGSHLFRYDEPNHYWVVPGSTSTEHGGGFSNLTNGEGYLYDNTANSVTLKFAGELKPSNNTVTLSDLSYTTTEGHRLPGWHLVGNPFPCKATINKDYYTISGNTLTAVTNGAAINPGQGVMVKVGADDNENDVTFTKFTGAKSSQIEMNVARTVANRGGAEVEDNAIVSFNENSMLEKFVFNADNAKLYIPRGNKEYAIIASELEGEVPVNFVAAENGSYTLNVKPENVEFTYLHLIDNKTGADVDLLTTPSYSFDATVTDYESRFRLLFSTDDTNEEANGDNTFAFFNGSEWVIANEGEATLQLVDVMGRVLVSKEGASTVSTTGMAPGVYTLRLVNGENVRTQKIVVR